MKQIRSKKDSILFMKEEKLNYFPLETFDKTDIKGIQNFFDENKENEYVLRSADSAKGQFYFVKNFEEAKSLLGLFEKNLTISVSYNPYKKDIILLGDIKVLKNRSGAVIDLTARDDEDATHRNIYEYAKYNIHCDEQDERLWEIKGVDEILGYIAKHNLFGYVVEFAVYDKKIGINKETVVISEIRTNY